MIHPASLLLFASFVTVSGTIVKAEQWHNPESNHNNNDTNPQDNSVHLYLDRNLQLIQVRDDSNTTIHNVHSSGGDHQEYKTDDYSYFYLDPLLSPKFSFRTSGMRVITIADQGQEHTFTFPPDQEQNGQKCWLIYHSGKRSEDTLIPASHSASGTPCPSPGEGRLFIDPHRLSQALQACADQNHRDCPDQDHGQHPDCYSDGDSGETIAPGSGLLLISVSDLLPSLPSSLTRGQEYSAAGYQDGPDSQDNQKRRPGGGFIEGMSPEQPLFNRMDGMARYVDQVSLILKGSLVDSYAWSPQLLQSLGKKRQDRDYMRDYMAAIVEHRERLVEVNVLRITAVQDPNIPREIQGILEFFEDNLNEDELVDIHQRILRSTTAELPKDKEYIDSDQLARSWHKAGDHWSGEVLKWLRIHRQELHQGANEIIHGSPQAGASPLQPSHTPSTLPGAGATGSSVHRQLTTPVILDTLGNHATHWQIIGMNLGFSISEMKMIEHNPASLIGAPKTWLTELLEQWLQWDSTGENEGRTATIENLVEAVRKANLGKTATDLKSALVGYTIGNGRPAPRQTFFENFPGMEITLGEREQDLNDIYELLDPVASEWYQLGLFLGVPADKLARLQAEHSSLEEKLTRVLSSWFNSGSAKLSILWDVLANKLHKISLANYLAKEALKQNKLRELQTLRKSMRLSDQDFNSIFTALQEHASNWKIIATQLGFTLPELDNITSHPMLLMEGPKGPLRKVLSNYLQWGPGDNRESPNFANLSQLTKAIEDALPEQADGIIKEIFQNLGVK